MGQHEIGEQTLGQMGRFHGFGKTLTHQNGLRCGFQDHGIAGHQRGHHGIDRCEIGIIPRRHDEHHAYGRLLNIAGKARFQRWYDGGQGFRRDADHMAGALFKPSELAAPFHRPAHLLRDFRHHFLVHGEHRIDKSGELRHALGKRNLSPDFLRRARFF